MKCPFGLELVFTVCRVWAFALAVVASIHISSAMNIVAEGKADAVIVIPDSPSAVVEYAGKELQDHIEKASGVRLEIVTEKLAPESKSRIYLGPCEATRLMGISEKDLPENGFAIKVDEKEMYLVGKDGSASPPLDDFGPMGTLFAVYDWLDTDLHVKWLWPGETGTVVPKKERIVSEDRPTKIHASPFIHTRLRFGGGSVFGGWRGVISPEGRNKFIRDTSVWLRRHRFVRIVSFEYGHAFEEYWDRFGKEHPEWFALRSDGLRAPLGPPQLVQMCVTNPGLHRQIVADWLQQRKKNPTLPWINGAENDKRSEDPSCGCPVCRAWDSKKSELKGTSNLDLFAPATEGGKKPSSQERTYNLSLSDRYAKFWLALQQEGRKHDPEATVIGYAYADYSEPPVETKLNDHVLVWVVPPYVFPLPPEEAKHFKEIWDGWARTGARLVLRPNYFLMGACLPYIFARQFGEEFKYAAIHGLVGTDFDSLTSMWGVQGPNLYMLGRLQEKPDLSVDEVLNEYYGGFGPAQDFIRQYFSYWEGITNREVTPEFLNSVPDVIFAGFPAHAEKIYNQDVLAQGQTFLDKAADAAKNDETALKRVEFLKKGFRQMELTLAAFAAHNKLRQNSENKALSKKFRTALEELDDFRKGIEADNVADLTYLNFVEERAGFGRKQIQMLGGKEQVTSLPLFWSFQWDPSGTGKDEKWYAPDRDVSEWPQARTDRSWNEQQIGDVADGEKKNSYRGYAWYRTDFSIPDKFKGRRIFLSFGALDDGGYIWVNGKLVGERHFDAAKNPQSWREPFLIDVTDAVTFDGTNAVAVMVEKLNVGAGGIWRPVTLVAE